MGRYVIFLPQFVSSDQSCFFHISESTEAIDLKFGQNNQNMLQVKVLKISPCLMT